MLAGNKDGPYLDLRSLDHQVQLQEQVDKYKQKKR